MKPSCLKELMRQACSGLLIAFMRFMKGRILSSGIYISPESLSRSLSSEASLMLCSEK